jgi:glutathione S-transferase
MKLYGHPLSSCTRKVLMTCAEKGAAIELVTVDLFAGDHKREPHVARHPFGVIPVLDDAGFMLYESRAIIRYLDRALPGPALTPSDTRAIARMDQWLSVDQSYIGPHTRTLAHQRIVRPHQGLAIEVEVANDAERALGNSLGVIDRALRGARYLAGDTFSLADVSLAPYVGSLAMIGADHLLADLGELRRWWDDITSRASWKRATAS